MGEKPIFVARYRVYWSETDAALIMHFSNFFRICERAEEDFLEEVDLLSYRDKFSPSKRIILPRVHAECDYSTPLRPGDYYRVELMELNLGNKSIEYRWRIFNETLDKNSATCRIVAAFYDERLGRATPIPKDFRERIREYIEKRG